MFERPLDDKDYDSKLPRWFIYAVCLCSFSPLLYNLLGGNAAVLGYSNESAIVHSHLEFAEKAHQLAGTNESTQTLGKFVDHLFYSLPGAFWHVIWEWSSVAIAFLSVILAFAHYRVRKNLVVPLIGIVMLCAGIMDLYHTLAAARLINVNAPNTHLIPFTWAEARLFSAVGFTIGALILLLKVKETQYTSVLIATGGGLLSAAFIIMSLTSASETLPISQYADALITRPYDVIPLVLYALLALILFPILNKRAPSIFFSSLILSMVPQIIAQIYMAFGSNALFDNGFNIGHYLKSLSYLIPCVGIIIDYVAISERGTHITNNLEALHNEITETVTRSVKELTVVAKKVGNGANVVSASSHKVRELVNKQFEYTTQCASAMEEMTVSVEDVSMNTRNVADTSLSANEKAVVGSKTVASSINSMEQIAKAVSSVAEKIEALNTSSEQIAKVVSVISTIADQTNLLALNAAIEAARAGEHGRGFSVVADEVRGLAAKTQHATNQIVTTVEINLTDTQTSVESMRHSMEMVSKGTESAASAKENMESIVKSFDQVTMMISQIATANDQQAAVAKEISHQLNHINEISAEVVETINSVADSAETLSRFSKKTLTLASQLSLESTKQEH